MTAPPQPPASSAAAHGADGRGQHPAGRYALQVHRLTLKEFWRASDNVLAFVVGVLLLKVLRLPASPKTTFEFPAELTAHPLPEWAERLFADADATLRAASFHIVQPGIALLKSTTPTYGRTYLSDDSLTFAQLMVGDHPESERVIALTLSSGRGAQRRVTSNAAQLLSQTHGFSVVHLDTQATADAVIAAHQSGATGPAYPLSVAEVGDIVREDNQRDLEALITRGLYVLDGEPAAD